MGKRSKVALVVLCLLAGGAAVGTTVAATAPWTAERSTTTSSTQSPSPPAVPGLSLQPVQRVRVGEAVRLSGTLEGVGSAEEATVTLQRRSNRRWVDVEADRPQFNGTYAFVRVFDQPKKSVFRTVAEQGANTLDVSATRKVAVAASKPSGEELPPDVGVKNLTECDRSEQPCFFIDSTAGRRLLKFPVVTVNVGTGPLEIHGYRSSVDSPDWIATLTTYYTSGDTRSETFPNADFYFSGDEHDHWHIRDFDSYQILDESGTSLRLGEKHGFCFEDNTTFRDWLDHPDKYPGVPRREVYKHHASCGEAAPFATSIVHGLSVGWADTYPSGLPDQAIDITDLPDGVYTVRIKADGRRLIEESNEKNNVATVKIKITGDKVTVDASSATGL